jgi:transmembrane protein EpsG
MGIYIVIVLLLILFSSFRNKKAFTIFSGILLIIISSIRSETVGTDYMAYSKQFEFANKLFENNVFEREFGWSYMNTFLSNSGYTIHILTAISALLTMIPVIYAILKNSKSPVTSLLLYVLFYYYCMSFNLVRQSIAISWFLLAVQFIGQRKLFPYFLSIVIGFLFHSSIIILAPAYLLLYVKLEKVFFPALIISFFLGILEVLNMKSLSSLVVFFRYEIYSGEILHGTINNYFFNILNNLLLIYIYYLIDEKNDIFFKTMFLSIVILNLLAAYPIFSRVSFYLKISEIIVIANLLAQRSLPLNKKLVFGALTYSYAIYLFTMNLITNNSSVVPYKTFLF